MARGAKNVYDAKNRHDANPMGRYMSQLRSSTIPVVTAVAATLFLAPGHGPAQEAEEAQVVSSAVTVTSGPRARAELELELADGTEHAISFRGGTVRVDGRSVGDYEAGGTLESAWRGLLSRHVGDPPAALGEALLDWEPSDLSGDQAATYRSLRERLRDILRVAPPAPAADAPAAETVTVTGPGGDQLAIAPGALSFEALTGRLERLQGSLEELGEAAEDARERLALIVHDDYAIPSERTVPGNLALLDGTLSLSGTVQGDVVLLDGTLVLEPSARIEGDLLQVGGTVEEAGGRIAGEILSLRPATPGTPRPPAEARQAPAPEAPSRPARVRVRHDDRGFFDRMGHYVGHAVDGVTGALSAFLVLGLLGLLAVYFARPQLEAVADTARYSFGRSFGMGLAGQVLFFPVVLILVVLVITWLVLPFFLLAVFLAVLAGYLASAHAVGEIFAARRWRYEWIERLRRSNSYYYVLSGLALLLLPFAIEAALWIFGGLAGFLRGLAAFVACVLTWLAATTGFGAVLLSRGGTQGEHVRPGGRWDGPEGGWPGFWSRHRPSGGPAGPSAAAEAAVEVEVEEEDSGVGAGGPEPREPGRDGPGQGGGTPGKGTSGGDEPDRGGGDA